MTPPFLYPLIADDGMLVDRIMNELRIIGIPVWPEGTTASQSIGRATAVLLLAGSAGRRVLPRLIDAKSARHPIRAAVLNDDGAALVTGLGLWHDAFDFRFGFEESFANLQAWLLENGLAPRKPEQKIARPLIFISYPRRDEAVARRLHSLLGMIGWGVYYYHGPERDREHESICLEINKNLEEAVGVLILRSQEWDNSKYCRSEWEKADRTNKRWLILMLRKSSDQYRLNDRLPIDLTHPEKDWWPELAHAISSWKNH